MTKTKKILLIILAIIVLIQFIHPAKNQGTIKASEDVFTSYPAPDSVKHLMVTVCYDCHSNNTIYPWYYNIQPVAWWLDYHIQEGKRKLNYSEFSKYDRKKADDKFHETVEFIKEKEMPLNSYTWIHKDARITDSQREGIIAWAEEAKKKVGYK